MRHRKKINHLGRTSSHRKAMLANMASSLILHKRITTTIAKAKALRVYVEPLLTRSKEDSTHSRRVVFSHLKNKYAVSELFREVSTKIADRPGGYTRILKTGTRLGDNADMCIIELVDYNENMLAATAEAKPAAKRRRRGRGKKGEEAVETPKAQKQEETTKSGKEAKAEAGAEEAESKVAEQQDENETKPGAEENDQSGPDDESGTTDEKQQE